jgi:hypothetical protein
MRRPKEIDLRIQERHGIQITNGINGIIKINFGKQMPNQTKLRIHNITAKTALKYGSETWVLNKRDKTTFGSSTDEIFKATRIYTIRPAKNVDIREKLRVQSRVEEIQTYQRK